MKESIINQYTIYKNPKDYPKKYVVRKWEIWAAGPKPGAHFVCDTLEEARSKIPPGMVKFVRNPKDDPAIYETWV